MEFAYDEFTVTESDDGVALWLPDGSSVGVPQAPATIGRSAVLQEALHASNTASDVSIRLPQGVLQDWLHSVHALKAAATPTEHGTDISHHPRLRKV